jgi:integrase
VVRAIMKLLTVKDVAEILNAKISTIYSWAEVIERYLREVSPHLSPATHSRNEQMCNNLKEFLGQCLLGDVSPSLLSQYKARKLEKGYRRETILREFGLLRRIFNIAIEEWELCKENPVRKALKTLGRADNKKVRYLTSEEIPRLMQALPGWLKPVVILARHTGLRRGNLLDLTWEQVNLSKKLIVVSRTKNGEPIGIPLSETASRTLTELQRVRYLHSPFVFCDRDGKSHTPFKVSVAFKRACKKAEIHDLRFHDLRHDFASNLVQSGVDIYTVRELLGHKDLRMTVRYCHLAPENLRKAVSVLDARESGYSLVTVGEKEKGCIAASP